MDLELLRPLVDAAPRAPGCYLWKDESGEVLYVGKAVVIRSRLRSYLKPLLPRTLLLMERARALEWITTEDGEQALLLESNLIKKYNPRYNVRLKDDKSYPWLCVSTSEPYPRIFITRQVRDDGNRYFGPYTDVRATRETLDLIHKLFPIRKIAQRLPLKKPKRPCMNFFIKRCLGPCQGNVAVKRYAEMIEELLLFLEGRSEMLETLLSARMREKSAALEFEEAARYRDMITNLRRTSGNESVMNPGGGDEDLLSVAREGDHGQMVVLEVRDGQVASRRSFPLLGLEGSEELEIYTSFIRDYYLSATLLPSRVVLPLRAERTLRELATLLSRQSLSQSEGEGESGRDFTIVEGRAPAQRSLLRIAARNSELLLKERLLASRVRDRSVALEEIGELLGLDYPPSSIECYDISHLQGEATVAAGVVFVDGEPQTSLYRIYNIRSVEGIDDPASIAEVIRRRLKRAASSRLPDLILIDGGPTQLNAARVECQSAGVEVALASLAKREEELYVPGRSRPLTVDRNSPALLLLRHLRDEAHRFGISRNRRKVAKSRLVSELDSIAGIGPERRREILRRLGKRELSALTVKELCEIPGIGAASAERIVAALRGEEKA